MLAESRVDQVAELLIDGGLSQRKIAQLTGISRGTVGAIARGTRPRHLRPKYADDDLYRPLGPPVRCRGCGGKVQMPCLLCRVRALSAIEQPILRSKGRCPSSQAPPGNSRPARLCLAISATSWPRTAGD
jgi:transcriptional regulator with XRE-family HTH domain